MLSYHDSLLHQSDVDLLRSAEWLNDTIIGFAFDYLQRDRFKQFTQDLVFIRPSITQLIKLASYDVLKTTLSPMELMTKKYVFLAVNDNASRVSEGGTHWSLLLFDRLHRWYIHYDSLAGSNLTAAKAIANSLEPHLHATRRVKFDCVKAPQQRNGYDCGVYVICVAEEVCRQLTKGILKPQLNGHSMAAVVAQHRALLKTRIYTLARQGYVQHDGYCICLYFSMGRDISGPVSPVNYCSKIGKHICTSKRTMHQMSAQITDL